MRNRPGQDRSDISDSSLTFMGLEPLEPRLLLSASLLDAQDPFLSVEASQDEVAALTSGTHTFGIDVSKWQGSINWGTVLGSGIEFVWAKATEGVDFVDIRWTTNINGAHNAGLYAGGYHFATPYTGGVNDAAAEASDFYDAVSPYLGDGFLRPALDLEGGSSLSTTVLSNWVHDFMNTFSALSGGIVPIIYMNQSFAISEVNSSVNIYDLWYARWPASPDFNNPPAAPGVFSSYDLWQYSSTTSVPGISGAVDGDVFFGDLSQFAAKYAISTIPDDHGDDLASATVVSMPSSTAGELEVGFDTDWFEMSLVGNEDYTFSLLANGLTSGELRLYSGAGTLLATDTGPAAGGTLAEIQFIPIAGGTYYLEVSSPSLAGGYDLAIQETDDHGDDIASATVITGPVTLGGIQNFGEPDFFRFTATAGMQYDIDVSEFAIFGSPLSDATLTLLTPGGATVLQDSGSNPGGTHAQINWVATSTGDMFISISAGPGSLGDYLLGLVESTAMLAGDLNSDGFVGVDDLNIVLGAWNQNVTPGDLPAGDPTGDGFVGIDDLNTVLSNWNAGTPPVAVVSSGGSSQEESTVLLAMDTAAATDDGTEADPQSHADTHRNSGNRDNVPAATAHTDRAQGLAIANWRASGRSPFDGGSSVGYAPAFGLWESDDDDSDNV